MSVVSTAAPAALASGAVAEVAAHLVTATCISTTSGFSEHRPVRHLEAHGSLLDVAPALHRQILLALCDEPAAVICDLSGAAPSLLQGPDRRLDDAISLLAGVGSEIGTWLGTPIAIVCPSVALRNRLDRERDCSLILVASLASALSEVQAMPRADGVHVTLPAAARSVRAARDVVGRTLLDWGCGAQIGIATMVAGELVGGAVARASGDVGLSVSRCGSQVRIAVRGGTPATAPLARSESRASGRAMLLVAALATSWGVLPAADGDRVVWVALSSDPAAGADRFCGAAVTRRRTAGLRRAPQPLDGDVRGTASVAAEDSEPDPRRRGGIPGLG